MSEFAEPIAIVGIAGRFPGAADVNRYWQNLCEGRESVHHPSDAELAALGVPPRDYEDPDYVKAVALAPGVDLFDAGHFGFTPREADLCDPQMRLLLETAHAAFENAGYAPGTVADVGVFAAGGVNRYGALQGKANGAMRSASGISLGVLNNTDYVATLVSYKFGFQGPSMTVQTACSSSMVATHLAVQALRNGECAMALAGGSAVEYPVGHGHWWAPGSPLSKEGHVRPFDRSAGGTIFGSGVGVVVLKRLSDALADGDRIRAVIRSTAINNDGSDKIGFSAPSVAGQSAAVVEAMRTAGVAPQDISYVEAHATGTPLGDPIEVAALSNAYRQLADTDLEPGRIALASVKGNIGHLGHAAGVAALIKMVLALENEQIPASINFSEANPKAEFERSPFYVNDTLRPWKRTRGAPRLSAVHSLGIGGTNVHTVLEEAPVTAPSPADGRPRVVVWSGRTPEAERDYRASIADHLAGTGEDLFTDTVTTLQRGRAIHQVRSAVVASSAAEALDALAGVPGAAAVVTGSGTKPRPVTFLFPGQGSQHPGMGAEMYAEDPVFAAALDECLDLLDAEGIEAGPTWRGTASGDRLEDTLYAQPLLFAVEYAMSATWTAWGVQPHRLLGHSVGELTAATVAGVFELHEAVRLVAARAKAMARMPAGGMLAVSAPVGTIEPLLPAGVDIAVVNGPRQTVVAAPRPALDAFAALLEKRGISARPVRTSHAFHSSAMTPAAEEFLRAFEGITPRPPRVPVHSAAAGTLLTEAQACDPSFWSGQLDSPVRFGAAVDGMLAEGDQFLLEVGPGQVLTSLVRQHPGITENGSAAVASMPRPGAAADERETVLKAAATLWTEGHALDWTALAATTPVRRAVVPGYPYQRVRHWIDDEGEQPAPTAAVSTAAVAPVPVAPDGGAADTEAAEPVPFSALSWREAPRPAAPAGAAGEVALAVLPPDSRRAADVTAALQQAGLRVVPVRAGDDYRQTPVSFRVRPDSSEDIERMFTALAARGSYPRLVVHAATLGSWQAATTRSAPPQLAGSFHAVLAYVQHAARRASGHPVPGLLVVTDRSVNVSGGEPVDPVKATLHGLVRTLTAEEPGAACKLVDIGAGVGESELVEEFADWAGGGLVALRGDRRWVRTEQQFTPVPAAAPAFRTGGVYLLTGGLGGLGLEVAKDLARTGLRPRLLLLGRTAPAEGEELRRRLDAGDAWTVRVQDALAEIEEMGASWRVVTADVADPAALRTALAQAQAETGPVCGVFHLAGVAGDGMLQFRDRASADAVLAPKVLGTLALAEVFATGPQLDFFVTFSSTAALRGLRGSGDYAAANAFLDAYTTAEPGFSRRVLDINWPAWNTVGMAVAGQGSLPADVAAGTAATWRTELSASRAPVLDEHRIGGQPVVPGTGYLDYVVRALRETVLDDGGPVRLTDVVFHAPLAVPGTRTMEIAFEAADTGWHFTVRSFADGEARAEHRLHVTGAADRAQPAARTADTEALFSGLPERSGPPAPGPGPRLVEFGPRWDNVAEIATDPTDRRRKVLTLALPAAFHDDLATHELHPALLDTATSFARDARGDGPHLPFMYRSITVYGRLPARILSRIDRRDSAEGLIVADVEVMAEDGRVLVEIEGFTMRRVEEGFDIRDAPAAGQEQAGDDDAPVLAPAGTTGPETAAGNATDRTGIDPEVGVALLRRLMAGRTPRQVAVAPFEDGRPVQVAERGQAPVPAEVPEAPAAVVTAAAAAAGLEPAREAAGTESLESDLRTLWTQSLGIDDIASEDDFFELGGNSLTAVDLMSQIRDRFGINLSIAALFEYPTLSAMAGELTAQSEN